MEFKLYLDDCTNIFLSNVITALGHGKKWHLAKLIIGALREGETYVSFTVSEVVDMLFAINSCDFIGNGSLIAANLITNLSNDYHLIDGSLKQLLDQAPITDFDEVKNHEVK